MNSTADNLDPKLKEVYEKVMGTSFNPNAQQPQEATVAAQPILQTQPVSQVPLASVFQPQTTPSVVEQTNSVSLNTPQITRPVNPTEIFKPVAHPNTQITPNDASEVKKRGISPVVLVLGGITFFVLYVVVWAKIFGLI